MIQMNDATRTETARAVSEADGKKAMRVYYTENG